MKAIYKRELKALFHNITGWLFIGITLFMMGIYFTVYNVMLGYPTMSYVLQSIVFLFIITIPILTMRILSEDRRSKTDQLIMTAPISISRIVLAKYFALMTIYSIPVLFNLLICFIMFFSGEFQLGVSLTALAGFFLYGCMAIAIGVFISSLTTNFIIAAMLSFVALFLGYIMSGICSMISSSGNVATQILSVFDMIGRFDSFTNGVFDLSAFVYFITFSVFMLYATMQVLYKRRYTISQRGLRFGVYNTFLTLLLCILLIGVNLFVPYLPEKLKTIDVTSNKMFTIMDTTKVLLSPIEDDVTIYVLSDEKNQDINLEKTLKQISELNKHFELKYIDPSINTLFYKNYAENEPSKNSIIVVSGERSRVIDFDDIYTYDIDYSTYDYTLTGYDGEGQLLSAIHYVTTDKMPKIYNITGHNELNLENQFVNAIKKENILLENLSLLSVDSVPEDADLVIVNAPTADFSEDDTSKIIDYLEKGGSIILIPTWTEQNLKNFNELLSYFEVTVVPGMIVEEDPSHYYQSPYYLLTDAGEQTVTSGLTSSTVFTPFAQGIDYDEESNEISYQPLLTTSDASFSKKNLDTSQNFEKAVEDTDGPFTVALAVQKPLQEQMGANAVIVATESLFTESADEMIPGNNERLFTGIINSLVDHESSVSIPVKSFDNNNNTFSRLSVMTAGFITILLLPLLCLIAGIVIYAVRNKQ